MRRCSSASVICAVEALTRLVYTIRDTPARAAASMALRALSNRSPTVVVETSTIASAPANASSRVARVGEVRAPHHDPALREAGEFADVPAGGHDLRGRCSGGEELVDDEPAEVA